MPRNLTMPQPSLTGRFALGAWENYAQADWPPLYLGAGDAYTATDPGCQVEEAHVRLFDTAQQARDYYTQNRACQINPRDYSAWVLGFDAGDRPVCVDKLE